MQPVLHTERLHMKPAALDDSDELALILGHHLSIEETRRFMRNVTAVSPLGRDDIGWWLLFDRETGAVVGDAILSPAPRLPMEIEVGWHLGLAHRGRGYATESARRLLEYGLEELGLNLIVADIADTNTGSISVAKRLGMTLRPDPIVRNGLPHAVWEVRKPEPG